jgi:hypothetical protein
MLIILVCYCIAYRENTLLQWIRLPPVQGAAGSGVPTKVWILNFIIRIGTQHGGSREI